MRTQDAAQIREGILVARIYGINAMPYIRENETLLTQRAYLRTLTKNEPQTARNS